MQHYVHFHTFDCVIVILIANDKKTAAEKSVYKIVSIVS